MNVDEMTDFETTGATKLLRTDLERPWRVPSFASEVAGVATMASIFGTMLGAGVAVMVAGHDAGWVLVIGGGFGFGSLFLSFGLFIWQATKRRVKADQWHSPPIIVRENPQRAEDIPVNRYGRPAGSVSRERYRTLPVGARKGSKDSYTFDTKQLDTLLRWYCDGVDEIRRDKWREIGVNAEYSVLCDWLVDAGLAEGVGRGYSWTVAGYYWMGGE